MGDGRWEMGVERDRGKFTMKIMENMKNIEGDESGTQP
jgi:hypothetical protein